MRILASDRGCDDAKLVERGYQFNIASSIPIDRLKSQDDAYKVIGTHAFTVKGCWSPVMHKVAWHRKHDGKEWEEDFKVDDTWTKIDDETQQDVQVKVPDDETKGLATKVDNDKKVNNNGMPLDKVTVLKNLRAKIGTDADKY
jgi:hypothetical protein